MHSDSEGYQGGLCQTMRVQPGQDYVYVARVYTDLAPASSASLMYWDFQRLRAFHVDSTGRVLENSTLRWVPYWRLVSVPAIVRTISVCPALLTGAGTVGIGQVWFVPLEVLK